MTVLASQPRPTRLRGSGAERLRTSATVRTVGIYGG